MQRQTKTQKRLNYSYIAQHATTFNQLSLVYKQIELIAINYVMLRSITPRTLMWIQAGTLQSIFDLCANFTAIPSRLAFDATAT